MGTILVIITSATVSILVTITTIYFSRKQFHETHSKEDIKLAIELSKIYATELMPKMNEIEFVYSNLEKLGPFVKIINRERKKGGDLDFSQEEANRLFSNEEIEDIKETIDTEKMPTELLMQWDAIKSIAHSNATLFNINLKLTEEDRGKLSKRKEMNLRYEFSEEKIKILNLLEYLSMNFSNGIADDNVVYQSLHQTFLGFGQYMYFDIAFMNTRPTDKFYVNFTTLFNQWNKRYVQKCNEEKAKLDELKNLAAKPKHYSNKKSP